jgi:hypothetical protein
MDLNHDIVLIELRVFARLLSSYIYSILDDKQKEKMKNGICNKMIKNYQPDVRAFSLDVLSDFVEHYREKNPIPISLENKTKTKSKTKSKTRSKSKHLANIKAKTI